MAIHDSNTGAKGTLYRGNYEPAEWSVGDKKITGWKEETKTGTDLTFEDTYNDKVLAAKVKGDSVQKSEWQNKEAVSSQVHTVQGKNLYNYAKAPPDIYSVFSESSPVIELAGSPSGRSTYLSCLPNTTYTISQLKNTRFAVGDCAVTPANAVTTRNTKSATYSSNFTGRISLTLTTSSDAQFIAIRYSHPTFDLDQAGLEWQTIKESIQVELGSTATSYEPFVPDSPSPDYPQPITTTIPAGTYRVQDYRGDWYEFTLPRDLHGIGDVRDSVEWDKYGRSGFSRGRIGTKVFDGTENWNITNNCFRFSITSSPVKHNSITGFCTHYKQGTVLGLWDNTMDMAFVLGSGYFGQLGVAHTAIRDSRFSDIPAFKAELANQYVANTPVTMYFQLATPTRTPLTFTLNNASTAPELPMDFLTDTPSADYPATIFSAEGEVIVKGRNLFNGVWENKVTNADGSIVANPQFGLSGLIRVIPLAKVSFFGEGVEENNLALYDANQQYIEHKGTVVSSSVNGYTVPHGIHFVRLRFKINGGFPLSTKAQLEQSPISTAYEPYRTPQTAPILALRSVNDIKDEFDVLSGRIKRKVSSVVEVPTNASWTSHQPPSKNVVRRLDGNLSGMNYYPYTENARIIKYDGVDLMVIPSATYGRDVAYFQSANAIRIGVHQDDSGWGMFGPNELTADEIRAYFYGWKMCHSDGTSPYQRSEIPYNPNTWAEWVVGSNVVANTSGLEYTVNEYGSATAGITAPIRPNINYGFIVDVVSSDGNIKLMIDAAGYYFQGSQVERQISDIAGKYKVLLTSLPSINAQNPLRITQIGSAGIGNKIKIKDIRLFELPPGSQIEADFNNLSADALAIKYKFYGENPKHWKRLVGTEAEIRNSITSTLPTESYDGFTPYRMIYELETPVIEQLEPTELKTYPHTTIAEVNNDTPAKAEITATVKTVDLN